MMQFRIKTLIDVTETNARKGAERLLVDQQANFNTLYNTIGLRTNPTEFKVFTEKVKVDGIFGSKYKNSQNVWTIEFTVEADQSTNIELMQQDFDLVPVVTNLKETVKLEKGLFITSSNPELTNIIFEELDK